MRASLAALGLTTLATPAVAAVLTAGLDPFTVDFRGGDAVSDIAAEGVPFDFGPVTATASGPPPSAGPDDNDPLTRSGSGLGVGGPWAIGRGEINGPYVVAGEAVTLTFEVPFLVESIGITNAGTDEVGGDTGIRVTKNGVPLGGSPFQSATGTTAGGPQGDWSTLVFAGLSEQSFGQGDTLTFTAQYLDSYTIGGIAGTIAAAPLPTAAWLFGGGLAAIGGYLRLGRWRRREI